MKKIIFICLVFLSLLVIGCTQVVDTEKGFGESQQLAFDDVVFAIDAIQLNDKYNNVGQVNLRVENKRQQPLKEDYDIQFRIEDKKENIVLEGERDDNALNFIVGHYGISYVSRNLRLPKGTLEKGDYVLVGDIYREDADEPFGQVKAPFKISPTIEKFQRFERGQIDIEGKKEFTKHEGYKFEVLGVHLNDNHNKIEQIDLYIKNEASTNHHSKYTFKAYVVNDAGDIVSGDSGAYTDSIFNVWHYWRHMTALKSSLFYTLADGTYTVVVDIYITDFNRRVGRILYPVEIRLDASSFQQGRFLKEVDRESRLTSSIDHKFRVTQGSMKLNTVGDSLDEIKYIISQSDKNLMSSSFHVTFQPNIITSEGDVVSVGDARKFLIFKFQFDDKDEIIEKYDPDLFYDVPPGDYWLHTHVFIDDDPVPQEHLTVPITFGPDAPRAQEARYEESK